jgi:hypothetical protein
MADLTGIMAYSYNVGEIGFSEVELRLFAVFGRSRETADGGTMYPVEGLTRHFQKRV